MPVFLFFFLFAAVNILYTEDIYTTSISLKKISNTSVRIGFDANTNAGPFYYWRATNAPVSTPELLRKALLIGSHNDPGVSNGDLFRFAGLIDRPETDGIYYYVVLPGKTNYERGDFLAGLNYTLKPLVWSNAAAVAVSNSASPGSSAALSSSSESAAASSASSSVPQLMPNITTVTRTQQNPALHVKVLTNFTVVMVTVTNTAATLTQDIYLPRVENLEMAPSGNNMLKLVWTSPIGNGIFRVYRSTNEPIFGPDSLARSQLIAALPMNGMFSNGTWRYDGLTDYLDHPGDYYYHVYLEGGITNDYYPGRSGNRLPVVLKTETVETPILPEITDLTVKKEQNSLRLFWKIGRYATDTEFRFLVYRTSFAVTNLSAILDLQPWKEVVDDFTVEDAGFEWGVPYYYTVLLGSRPVLSPGSNAMTTPVFFGLTNRNVTVEREIIRTNVRFDDYIEKFQK